MKHEAPDTPFRHRLHSIIFEAETSAGRRFDVALVILILISIALVFAESVASIRDVAGNSLLYAEYAITLLFTIEYLLRLYAVRKPLRYVFSFYGMVDLLALLPTWLDLFFPGLHSLMSIRTIRLLRVFRLLKLTAYIAAGQAIVHSLKASRRKISIFIFAVLINAILFGSLMYLVEGEQSGFTSIPTSVYWAVVTMTTVGYGDISPVTPLGQFIAVVLMIMGFGIIAVPTGIVTAEMALASAMKKNRRLTETCKECQCEGHDHDAVFCRRCGAKLNP
jgi:voltage-gated potassium channel